MKNMNKYVDMEAMKAKYAEESPDEQQSRKRKLLFPAFINFAVGIAMVVVGAVYNDQDQIGSATDFLMIGGSVLLTTNFIKLVAYSTPCKEDDKVADVITPILDLAYFIIIIWGSVKVFSAYSTWTDEDDQKDSANYCPGPPFMMAFVTLICFWILFPLMCCCGCFAACCKIAATMSPPKTTPHEPIE